MSDDKRSNYSVPVHSTTSSEAKAFEKERAAEGFRYIGRRVPNREAEQKAAGEMRYIDDLRFPGMLHGRILFSPHAHARIVGIDTSVAEAIPGVHAIVHCFNTEKRLFNSAARFYLDSSPIDMPKTEYVFYDTVRFAGDRVAAAAAESPELAEAALKAIRVDYELLPAVLSLEQALSLDAPQANPHGLDGSNLCGGYVSYGSTEEEKVLTAIEASDHHYTSTFRTSRVHHGYMEPVCHIADYTRDGKLTIWTSSQNVFCFRDVLSTALGIPQNRIRVIKTVSGGAFGGKLEIMHEPAAALLAMKSRRPVKVLLSRRETFASSRSRHEGILTISSGISQAGKLTAQHVASRLNTGAYAGSGPNTVGAQSGKTFILYRAEAMYYSGAPYYTNTPIAGAMRGYGCPQIMVARETHIDQLAKTIGIDPVEFRLRNVILPYEKNCMGSSMHNARAADCIRLGAEAFAWTRRRAAAEKFNRTAGRYRKGIGMGIAVHGNGWYPVYQDLTTITIRMNNDGSAVLLTGTHDLGTGSRTILAQIAAEVLRIEPRMIEVIEADTEVTPLDLGAQASRTTYIGGNATILAALDVRKQLVTEAAAILSVPEQRLDLESGFAVDRENPQIRCPYDKIIAAAQAGKHGSQREIAATRTFESRDSIDSYAAVYCEVEIDTSTGAVRPVEIISVHNSGKVINPLLFEGQIHGGIHMGLGYALKEEMIIDEKSGKLVNPTFRKYEMFKAVDMPKISVLTVESPEEPGPFGAKSIGECATDGVAGAVVNAVSHGLGGIYLNRIPLKLDYIRELIDRGIT